jgi:hypothetical protein
MIHQLDQFTPTRFSPAKQTLHIHHATAFMNDRTRTKRNLAEPAQHREQHRGQRRIEEIEKIVEIAGVKIFLPCRICCPAQN